MSTTATMLVLLSAALHVSWNSLAKGSASPVVFMGIKGGFLLLLASGLTPFMGLSEVPYSAWWAVGLSGVLHAAYAVSLARAYEQGDISFVYPIARSAPAFVPLFAWALLGEQLTLMGGAGIALVVVSVFLLQTLQGGLTPRSIRRSLGRSDGRWALSTLGCVVAYSLVDKVGMRALAHSSAIATPMRAPLYFLLENAIAYSLYLLMLARHPPPDCVAIFRGEWRTAMLGALFTMASYSLVLHIMQTEPLSYIVAVRQCSVVLAALYGWLWLRESHGGQRLALSLLIVGGVTLVVAFG